jgi:hypothetical protein
MTTNGRTGRLCHHRQKAGAFADQKRNERTGANPPADAALAAHIFGRRKMARASRDRQVHDTDFIDGLGCEIRRTMCGLPSRPWSHGEGQKLLNLEEAREGENEGKCKSGGGHELGPVFVDSGVLEFSSSSLSTLPPSYYRRPRAYLCVSGCFLALRKSWSKKQSSMRCESGNPESPCKQTRNEKLPSHIGVKDRP